MVYMSHCRRVRCARRPSTSSSVPEGCTRRCGGWLLVPRPDIHNLGYWVAAFASTGYRRATNSLYVAYGMPGRMVGRFTMRGDATMFLLIFTADHLKAPRPRELRL